MGPRIPRVSCLISIVSREVVLEFIPLNGNINFQLARVFHCLRRTLALVILILIPEFHSAYAASQAVRVFQVVNDIPHLNASASSVSCMMHNFFQSETNDPAGSWVEKSYYHLSFPM